MVKRVFLYSKEEAQKVGIGGAPIIKKLFLMIIVTIIIIGTIIGISFLFKDSFGILFFLLIVVAPISALAIGVYFGIGFSEKRVAWSSSFAITDNENIYYIQSPYWCSPEVIQKLIESDSETGIYREIKKIYEFNEDKKKFIITCDCDEISKSNHKVNIKNLSNKKLKIFKSFNNMEDLKQLLKSKM